MFQDVFSLAYFVFADPKVKINVLGACFSFLLVDKVSMGMMVLCNLPHSTHTFLLTQRTLDEEFRDWSVIKW